jgi:hypothetical protein
MELTEKLLVSLGGWPAFGRAKGLHESGAVSEASYDPPLLKGKIRQGGKTFLSGLKMKSSSDIENLCPCRESRQRGMICEHALAIGVAVLRPRAAETVKEPVINSLPVASARSTEAAPKVKVKLEGSLRHLEADIRFEYPQPDVSNPRFEAGVYRELLEAGFEEAGGKPVLRGEDGVLAFLAGSLPKWKTAWDVETGERFEHVTKDIVTIEPQFAMRERDDGWLDFHVHFHAGKEAV